MILLHVCSLLFTSFFFNMCIIGLNSIDFNQNEREIRPLISFVEHYSSKTDGNKKKLQLIKHVYASKIGNQFVNFTEFHV